MFQEFSERNPHANTAKLGARRSGLRTQPQHLTCDNHLPALIGASSPPQGRDITSRRSAVTEKASPPSTLDIEQRRGFILIANHVCGIRTLGASTIIIVIVKK